MKRSNRKAIPEAEAKKFEFDAFEPITKDSLSDEDLNNLRKLCPEFGLMTGEKEVHGLKKVTDKIGYDPMSQACGVCPLSLACMDYASETYFIDQAEFLREELGGGYFYDEDRTEELIDAYQEETYKVIKSIWAKDKYPKKHKLIERFEFYCVDPEGLRTEDPEMPNVIYSGILNKYPDIIEKVDDEGYTRLYPAE